METRYQKLNSLIEAVTNEVQRLVMGGATTSKRSAKRTASHSAREERRTKIYSAINSGRSKAWIMNQFKLAEYEYRGYKAAHTRGHATKA
jgi:hypothetical protein